LFKQPTILSVFLATLFYWVVVIYCLRC